MALSGSIVNNIYFTSADSEIPKKVVIDWEVTSQSVKNNSSTIAYSVYIDGNGALDDEYGVNFLIENLKFTNSYGSTLASHSMNTGKTVANSPKLFFSGTFILSHRYALDTQPYFNYEFKLYHKYPNYSYTSNGTYKGYRYVDAIKRKVLIDSAPEFNDEENPTIQYSLCADLKAEEISDLQACISFTGANDDIPYRAISVEDNNYTFQLTDTERKKLRQWVTGVNSVAVRFYIKAVINGETRIDFVTKMFTLVNHTPLLAPEVKDSNARSVYLTGDNNKFIRYISYADFDTGAQARKEAAISSQYVINGSQTIYNTSMGTIQNVDSNTFYFSATDTRGYNIKDFIVVDLIPYVKLSCRISKATMNVDGELSFTVTGNYYNGSFGAVDNKLEMEYSIREENGDVEWVITEATPEYKDNTYTFSHTITGLDYQKRYVITANVIDEAMSKETTSVTVSAIPVFDWSAEDFRHNTKVIFNEDIEIASGKGIISDNLKINGFSIGTNNLLWSGASHMNGNQSITLNDAISNQANGVVLVFSLYRNNAADNVSINSFFISKKQIELLEGSPHSFFMLVNAGFSMLGAKYLYINDRSISGHEGNTSSGNNSGITFNNSNYVLRYVIGV